MNFQQVNGSLKRLGAALAPRGVGQKWARSCCTPLCSINDDQPITPHELHIAAFDGSAALQERLSRS